MNNENSASAFMLCILPFKCYFMVLYKIKKRNGTTVSFERTKIEKAIRLAIQAVGGEDFSQLTEMTDKVIEIVKQFNGTRIPDVEHVQDAVEKVLIKEGHDQVAKAYISYRQQRALARKDKRTMLDVEKTMEEYLQNIDRRINENANIGYSIGGMILKNSEKITANYRLSHIYPPEVGDAHRSADYHIHDLWMFCGYCAGRSLRQLLEEGFNGVEGKLQSSPPRNLQSAVNQMINFLGTLQNERAGAQAYSSFDTYLAPFIHKYEQALVEELNELGAIFENKEAKEKYIYKKTYKYVKQQMQNFIFGLNVPSRWGTQTPFTNITLDWVCPEDLKEKALFMWGIKHGAYEKKYGELESQMKLLNRVLIDVYTEGDRKGAVFTFPIPTYNITEDFPWDDPDVEALFEMTAKYGLPYFQNFIGSQYIIETDATGKKTKIRNPNAYEPGAVRSMCPLTPDTSLFVKSSMNGIRKMPIWEMVKWMEGKWTKYEVRSNTWWILAKPIKTPATKVYKITLSNGVEVKMWEDHLQPTRENGVLHAHQLKSWMRLPFNKKAFGWTWWSRDLWYAIGAFLWDGSKDNEWINYSLAGDGTDEETKNNLIRFRWDLWYPIHITIKDKLMSVRIWMNAFEIIKRFIVWDRAINKWMSKNCFNTSLECRTWILQWYADTDGSKEKKRLYTVSPQLREDLVSLLFSLGMKAMATNVDMREGRISDSPIYRVDYPERSRYWELYDEDDNYFYFKITNIEDVSYTWAYLYCIEVNSDEHVFSLWNGLITHNCRLQLDLNELKKRWWWLFGSAEMTGSLGVVTLNMPKIGYMYKGDEVGFKKQIRHLMDLAKTSLELKRKEVSKRLERGLYPYTKRYLADFRNHFSTIGINGMNEAVLNFSDGKEDISTQWGKNFAEDILDFMREGLKEYQEETGNLYNLEATPAEGTTYRFAKEDKKQLPGIIQAGTEEAPYYTNSSQLPVGFTDDPFEALDEQDVLQGKYTGGTVLHLYMGERLGSAEACKNFVKTVISNYTLPYITITPTFSLCPKHGYIAGEHDFCPKCDEEIGRTGEEFDMETRRKYTDDREKLQGLAKKIKVK